MAVNPQIRDYCRVLTREMDACLASREYARAMACLSPAVQASIFGADLKPQNLKDLHMLVHNVKRSMFCGAQHIFCVYVRRRRREDGEDYGEGEFVPWYVPEEHQAGACDWEFKLPEHKHLELYANTLFSAPTPVLSLWWHGINDDKEKKASIGGEDDGILTNDFVLEVGKPFLLCYWLQVDGEHDNDIVRVKDANGGVILTMSFHSAAWRKDRDNKALVYSFDRGQDDWVTDNTHAGLTALLGRLRLGARVQLI